MNRRNPYYRFPNFSRDSVDLGDLEGSDTDTRGISPKSSRMEYIAGDRFRVTFDGIHNSFSITNRNVPDFITDENGDQVLNTENIEIEEKLTILSSYFVTSSNQKLNKLEHFFVRTVMYFIFVAIRLLKY